MELIEARRLTGPNLISHGPGAILEVSCTEDEAAAFRPLWRSNVERMLKALDWPPSRFVSKKLLGGISLAFSAPVDALYAASEINEWAWTVTAQEMGQDLTVPDFDESVAAIRASIAGEANPELMQLIETARQRDKTLLWDDDFVSVGLGRHSKTWPVREIPASVDWDRHGDIPVGLVTGTNGKTTTVRLATHISRAAGKNVGLSSTDWIAVNDRVIDRGDWSGPGGARAVLREQDVDIAILESARGGLLRRGLGVNRADAALITNIAEDHLGDFGSRSLAELLDVKWIVSRAVRREGRLILNADDPLLTEKAAAHGGEVGWFSLDAENPIVESAARAGALCFGLKGANLVKLEGGREQAICRSDEIPITLGGAARHNVANALAAAALTYSLGIPVASIRQGLTTMDQDGNPGRCNVYDLDGYKVLVDFAHNPAAMHALFDMAQALPARRRVLCFGQAGDRPDDLIREMTRDAWAIGLDRVVISELADYHRGRDHGEVYGVIRDELLAAGADVSQIVHHDQELDSLNDALDWARPGDLVIMLALASAANVQARLKERGAE